MPAFAALQMQRPALRQGFDEICLQRQLFSPNLQLLRKMPPGTGGAPQEGQKSLMEAISKNRLHPRTLPSCVDVADFWK